jgi:outer membrane autotransporter protein
VVQLDAPAARSAFDRLSGEIHASARSALIEDSRFVREAALDRLQAGACGVSGADVTLAVERSGGPADTGCDGAQTVAWMRALGSWGRIAGDGNAARLGRSTGGLLLGADRQFPGDWRLGALAGFSRTRIDAPVRNSSGQSDSVHLGLYAGKQWGDLAARAGAAYTWHDLSTQRSVAFPGFADRQEGDTRAGLAAGTGGRRRVHRGRRAGRQERGGDRRGAGLRHRQQHHAGRFVQRAVRLGREGQRRARQFAAEVLMIARRSFIRAAGPCPCMGLRAGAIRSPDGARRRKRRPVP